MATPSFHRPLITINDLSYNIMNIIIFTNTLVVYLRCLWKSWTCPDNIMDVRRGKSNLFGLVQKQTVAPLAYHGDSEDVECYLRASLQCKRRATPAGASIKRSF